MKALVVGASAGIGRAVAEALAERGADLHLVASDARDTAAVACDLGLRFGVKAGATAADLVRLDPAALRRAVLGSLGGLDALVYVAGLSMMERDPDRLSDADIEALAAVNFTAAARLVNAFLPELESNPRADLVGIGSIAQARPRGRNTVYAASKAALEFHFEGLRHRFGDRGACVRFYRVGYADTQMTYGQSLALPKASPESVARAVISGLGRRAGPRYVPSWWSPIAAAYRTVPWFLFKRMGG